jgi:hypothetical protein
MCKKRESPITNAATGQAAVPVVMAIFVLLTLAAWGFMLYQLRSQQMMKRPDLESGLANPRGGPDGSSLAQQPHRGSSSRKRRRFFDLFKKPEPESGPGASAPEDPVPLTAVAPTIPATAVRRSAPI